MNIILVPLEIELRAFLKSLEESGLSVVRHSRDWAEISELKTFVALGGLGQKKFSQNLSRILLNNKEISSVFGMGSCGSLSDEVRIGDIIIANQIVDCNSDSFVFKNISGYKNYEKKIRSFDTLNSIHFGSIACVDKNIDSNLKRKELFKKSLSLGVCWEAIGGALVCEKKNLKYNEWRVTTDLADKNYKKSFYSQVDQGLSLLAKLYLKIS